MDNLLDSLTGIIAILSIFALPIVAVMYILYMRWKHRERYELIKQGIVPSEQPQKESIPSRYRSLRNGCLAVGIGIGLIVGFIVNHCCGYGCIVDHSCGYIDTDSFIVFCSSILLFLGLSYFLFFAITKDKNMNEE